MPLSTTGYDRSIARFSRERIERARDPLVGMLPNSGNARARLDSVSHRRDGSWLLRFQNECMTRAPGWSARIAQARSEMRAVDQSQQLGGEIGGVADEKMSSLSLTKPAA